VLALCLLGLLAGVGLLTLQSAGEQQHFEEGVFRFEALLRMARGDASSSGRRVRLSPQAGPDGVRIRILVEQEADGSPEPFVPHEACTWRDLLPAGLAEVVRSQRVGDDALRANPRLDGWGAAGPALEAITFYPDGSSDSAAFELAPPDADDPRRAVVRLHGATGKITTVRCAADELPAQYERMGLWEDRR
jgi:hypothetical protein